ncbi:UTP--glucose-1-phosphate uridylyltransferase [Halorhodospira halochloris]|uniref:UTP--glucose-1-phosphate uridylyltransferase n=1 Tax=Halorhodospira halochloris TaxID=1052 RepID=A0A110B4R6_HALHR|nr:UTP--glucose-1-phosphate uridylyltransferase GalU [Halorhodospira halochloris]MBK1652268.1 UTP--glucose-1-phosphate uridylyltransferase [Halorhodospira halochloris]BAU56938.1 UTP--glucose-1-phosphate uridylyltransferase [Halorhodospira halochloris]
MSTPNKPIRTVVFPVAGLGTRFLPATKASPKEMLPIVDRPLIQYAVDEAAAAGAEYLVFVTGRTKRAIGDHFDTATELEHELEAKGKYELLDTVKNTVPPGLSCIYIRQGRALGLGHAVASARAAVGRREPFGVILADDLIDTADQLPVLAQMAAVVEEYGGSVLGVERVPHQETDKYGVVEGESIASGITAVKGMVEKPEPNEAPSNLAVVGRYILERDIFEYLEQTQPDKRGEIQLTDAIVAMMQERPVYAYEYSGRRYDCGDKLGYLKAGAAYGLQHPSLGPAFEAYLRELLDERSRG